MIRAPLGHMQFNVQSENLAFYRDLMAFLGWGKSYDDDGMLMVESSGVTIAFIGEVKNVANDYDGPGMNHIAFAAASIADVDAAVEYLKQQAVAALFETPRHRPEFSSDADTYYQVMFESPDRILIEIVYAGPK
jgi:catechol 2,3-dioxygenase-like lactoylglutathione lyase family enzyme